MSIFSRFPYSDFHRLNADWILEKLKEMIGLTQDAAEEAQAAAETVATYGYRLTAVEADAAGAVRFDESQTLNSTQKTQARNNIGAASASALETLDDVVWSQGSSITQLQGASVRTDQPQSFSDAQQLQGRQNIGAAASADIPTDYVAYTSQSLTNDQKTQARNNISAAPSTMPGAVRYDAAQSLTSGQQQQARENIGAASMDAVISGAVLYSTAQALNTSEKAQARTNIGARSQTDPGFDLIEIHSSSESGIMDVDVTVSDSVSGPVLVLDGVDDQGSGNDVKITGVAAPSAGNDAVNKTYADSVRGMALSTVSGSDVVIQPDAVGALPNTLYVCSSTALNSLEITTGQSYAANREFTVRFTSGATATELTTPLDILGLDDLIPETNTIYEINVLGNLAVWHSWEVPSP